MKRWIMASAQQIKATREAATRPIDCSGFFSMSNFRLLSLTLPIRSMTHLGSLGFWLITSMIAQRRPIRAATVRKRLPHTRLKFVEHRVLPWACLSLALRLV